MRSAVTVLMYHRVLEDADCADYPFPSIVMPRTSFEAQLDYLAEHARVLTVAAALRELRANPQSAKPMVCLTFDDGYVDNVEIAAPLLEARGLRGTFFITAGAVQARTPLWYDRAAELWSLVGPRKVNELAHQLSADPAPTLRDRESWIEWLKVIPNEQRSEMIRLLEAAGGDTVSPCPLMTADQVRRLASQGHEIGSHTLSHPILTTMDADERRAEVNGAKSLLEEWTGTKVSGFCYPNGDYDASVARQLCDAGHEYACTTVAGRNDRHTDRFELRRIDITPDRVSDAGGRFDVLGFRAEISALHPALRRLPRLFG